MAFPSKSAAMPRARQRSLAMPSLAALSTLGVIWGWSTREELYFTPQSGLGYFLGIFGTVLMVLLLLYSLRKRLRRMRSWGPIRHWFGIHMILGVLGPVAILFHANFRLGSVNSTVALACVLLVSSSGVVGRFIYPKIHYGLYGSRASLRELKRRAELSRGAVGSIIDASPALASKLASVESFALTEKRSVLGSVWRFISMPPRIRATRRRCRKLLRSSVPAARAREAERTVATYLDGLRRVAEFDTYERLFSLWHAFHLPLCVMLFLAAAVHVVAVHMY